MKILITGASGFIGSFIVEEALRREMDVWAVVRRSSSKEYLKDSRIHFIELDFSDEGKLREQLSAHRFDYVVHSAGVTKCLKSSDFYRVNTEGTKHLVNALIATGQPLQRFVFLSSLSIYGPVREKQPYQEIREQDTPCPNTAYGKSKLAAERFLDSLNAACGGHAATPCKTSDNAEKACEEAASTTSAFPYVVLRPTGVYGPREKDYFMMAQSIKNHTDFSVGYKPQDLTFVYVSDVVQAVFLALERGKTGRKYFLSDGNVYSSRTFSDLLCRELGHPWVLRIKAPLWFLRAVTCLGEAVGHLRGKVTALNNDKFHIMRQRNWRCDITPAREELGYHPQVDLEEGVRRSVRWYREQGWL